MYIEKNNILWYIYNIKKEGRNVNESILKKLIALIILVAIAITHMSFLSIVNAASSDYPTEISITMKRCILQYMIKQWQFLQ